MVTPPVKKKLKIKNYKNGLVVVAYMLVNHRFISTCAHTHTLSRTTHNAHTHTLTHNTQCTHSHSHAQPQCTHSHAQHTLSLTGCTHATLMTRIQHIKTRNGFIMQAVVLSPVPCQESASQQKVLVSNDFWGGGGESVISGERPNL